MKQIFDVPVTAGVGSNRRRTEKPVHVTRAWPKA